MVTTEWTLEHDGHFEHIRVGAWTTGTSRYRRWSPRSHRGHGRRGNQEPEMRIVQRAANDAGDGPGCRAFCPPRKTSSADCWRIAS